MARSAWYQREVKKAIGDVDAEEDLGQSRRGRWRAACGRRKSTVMPPRRPCAMTAPRDEPAEHADEALRLAELQPDGLDDGEEADRARR